MPLSLPSSVGWYTSEFTKVIPSSVITLNTFKYLCQYNIHKTFISGTRLDNADESAETVTLNADTEYIRVSLNTTKLNTMQIEYGAVVTNYEDVSYAMYGGGIKISEVDCNLKPVVQTIKQDVEILKAKPYANIRLSGKNLYDSKKSIADKIIAVNGTLGIMVGWYTSDFIEVDANTTYTASGKPRYIAQYDANKVFIAGTRLDIPTTVNTTFTTNSNAVYVKCTMNATAFEVFQLELGEFVTSYEPAIYSLFLDEIKIYDLTNGGDNVSTNLLALSDYTKYVDRQKYQIWKKTDALSQEVHAIYKDIVVKYKSPTIYISTTGINGVYSNTVDFTIANFPNLIIGSTIKHIIIIPYTRNYAGNQSAENYRIVIITDKGQIYHNFPSRAIGTDGSSLAGDITKFDESVIWDLPERKLPSKSTSASGVEFYFPALADDSYQFTPLLNADNGYGHGGFDKSKTVYDTTYPRFYQPRRSDNQNSFKFFGGFEPTDKISMIGTYTSNAFENEGCRIGIFVTDDGGRQWHCKYEFSDNGTDSSKNWANDIDTTTMATEYVANSFSMLKRNLVIPTALVKEPTTNFFIR